MRKLCHRCVRVVLTLVVLAVTGQAATIRVPSEQPTIQAGIDAASESDTVLVAPGTYTGPGNYDILMDGKGLVIRSESGPAATIIDCEGNGRGFRLEGPMLTDPVIEGFTIMNGRSVLGKDGGGVLVWSLSPTIRFCVFAGNQGEDGGALYVYSGSAFANPRLENCTFVGNEASSRGSACYAVAAHVEVIRCLFYQNLAEYNEPLSGLGSTGTYSVQCSNSIDNTPIDWYGGSCQYGVLGNVSLHPMLCDVASGQYGLHVSSLMRPGTSPCGELVGALGVSCSDCYDIDSDGWCAEDDNCPVHANPDQMDTDGNGIGNACEDIDEDGLPSSADNCWLVYNPGQEDKDEDGMGDACDDDIDGDGYANESDNCPEDYNPGQEDRTGDGVGDVCCCVDRVGDTNGIGGDEPTIGDISVLIDVLFISVDWDKVLCLREADINQSGGCYPVEGDITIGDISTLIDYLFISSGSLKLCCR